jgi:hypothetical protein
MRGSRNCSGCGSGCSACGGWHSPHSVHSCARNGLLQGIYSPSYYFLNKAVDPLISGSLREQEGPYDPEYFKNMWLRGNGMRISTIYRRLPIVFRSLTTDRQLTLLQYLILYIQLHQKQLITKSKAFSAIFCYANNSPATGQPSHHSHTHLSRPEFAHVHSHNHKTPAHSEAHPHLHNSIRLYNNYIAHL